MSASPFPFSMVPVTPANASHTIPETLRLIKALALFERDPNAVVATEELLRKAFFGDDKAGGRTYAECVLVYEEGKKPEDEGAKAIAMAVWFYTFSTWTGRGGLYLEDLFVEEPYRGKGIAKKLFQHLGKICDERELPRMEWVVINWNQEAIKVYDKMGSLTMSEWDLRRLEGSALKKLAQ
ncbi:hypothetical protein JCM10908_002880 [Rhodotorula pacifica]|uniref:GNAT family N-acetyltransferase n=1 Tax=Rhodotorula pacifica TaxID=1495444 RepID=UPI00317743AF